MLLLFKKSTKTSPKSAPVTPPKVEEVKLVEENPIESNISKREETQNDFMSIVDELETMKKQISKIISTVKVLQKNSVKKHRNQNIKSGFVKPVTISKEMGGVHGNKGKRACTT